MITKKKLSCTASYNGLATQHWPLLNEFGISYLEDVQKKAIVRDRAVIWYVLYSGDNLRVNCGYDTIVD